MKEETTKLGFDSADALLEGIRKLENTVLSTPEHYQISRDLAELVCLASAVCATAYDDQEAAINDLEEFLR